MGLFRKKADPAKALEKMLQGVEAPTFPQLTLGILKKIRDPDATLEDITASLQWDPGLIVRILRTVNTAAFGPANPIRDVGHAVSYMGRAQLEQIVLAIAVQDALPDEPARGFDASRFWGAAARRATLSRIFAERLHPALTAESFTGGLLQDMAIPVLATARKTEYGPLLERWHTDSSTSLPELERETLGWTHADVGGLLGKIWELPNPLTASIYGHHRPDTPDELLPPALRLVASLRESQGDHGVEVLVHEARDRYSLDPDWVVGAVDRAREEASDLADLLGGSSKAA